MFLSLIAQTAAQGQAFDRGISVRSPALAASVVWCPRCLFTCSWEAGSCTSFAGVSSSWLGWDELLCSCPPPQTLYLAWVLSCFGAVLAGDFPSADLFLNSLYLCSWRLQLLRAIGYAFALSRYEVNGQLSSSLAEAPSALIKIACHLSVWRKGWSL